jgi:hypothetical protein
VRITERISVANPDGESAIFALAHRALQLEADAAHTVVQRIRARQ